LYFEALFNLIPKNKWQKKNPKFSTLVFSVAYVSYMEQEWGKCCIQLVVIIYSIHAL
jgi:hypothetical protein